MSARKAIFKDSYLVDFLNLPERHSKQQLQAATIMSLKRFLLEVGQDFAFVGEQYLLQVGSQDFRRDLQSLVAIEFKVDEYKREYLGSYVRSGQEGLPPHRKSIMYGEGDGRKI